MSTAIARNFQIGIDPTPSNNFTLYQPATPDGTLRLGNGNTGITSSLLTLTSAGNLGINTTSPSTRLTVGRVDSANEGGQIDLCRSSDNASAWAVDVFGNTSTPSLRFIDNVAAAARMVIDGSGNVGIGTSSPDYQLDVSGSSTSTTTLGVGISVENLSFTTNTRAGIVFRNGDNYGASVWSPRTGSAAGFLVFGTNGGGGTAETNIAERARIDSSGNLLVGTTSLSQRLSVTAATEVGGFQNTSGTGNVRFYNSGGSTIGFIQWSGSSTSYNTSSDYRLKHDIAPMTGALARVAALKPVTYKWNADNSDGEGFIAHELAEVVPQAVSGEKDAVDAEGNPQYQGIDTSFLVATLTAAIQELNAKLEAQAAEIAALKGTA